MSNIIAQKNSNSITAFLDHLEQVKQIHPNQWMALCPGHHDTDPSLSIKEKDGKILLKCFSGCSIEQILKPLNLETKDLFINSNGNAYHNSSERKIVAIYDYTDANGKPFQVVRTEPKGFYQRQPDGNGGYIYNLHGIVPTLYHQDEVINAISRGDQVFIVEGEKDVETLRAAGAIATTNAGGAGKWRSSYTNVFSNADAVILPDQDKPGLEHGHSIASQLLDVADRVRLLELTSVKDITEWFENGGKYEELMQLAEVTPPYQLPVNDIVPSEDVKNYNRTDTGNAELFADQYGTQLRFDHRRKRWLEWHQHYWRTDTDGQVTRLAINALRQRGRDSVKIQDLELRKKEAVWCISSEQRSRIEAMIAIATNLHPIADSGEDWDADPWLFCVANGVIDLRTGELRPGKPEDRITMRSDVKYDPDADCPRWRQFQQEIHPGDNDLIEWKQRYLGYSLTGDTREQVFAIPHGHGENGKGVETRTLRRIYGDYAYDAPFSTFELYNRAAIPNDMAALVHRRFVTSSETNEGTRLNEARIKQLTGQDPVTARFLHAEWFTFQPELKLWLAVNHPPVVQDGSHGMWRRVCLIPYGETFTGPRRDDELNKKLEAELPGILNWLIEGCLKWQQDGLGEKPHSVVEATEDYRADSDDLGDFMATLIVHPNARIAAKDLYKEYRKWAEDQGMREKDLMSSTNFGRKMSQKFKKVRSRGGNVYCGVGSSVQGCVYSFETTEKNSGLGFNFNSHGEKNPNNPTQPYISFENPTPPNVHGSDDTLHNPALEADNGEIPACPGCGKWDRTTMTPDGKYQCGGCGNIYDANDAKNGKGESHETF